MSALGPGLALGALSLAALAFIAIGLLAARRIGADARAHVAAHNSMSSGATAATVLATSLGAWILFAPAEMATWGGLAAVTGYAIAAATPRFALAVLGLRMRALMPRQIAMTEFLRRRFGRGMHGFCLIVMVFFLVTTVAAEVTGMALLVALIADVPLWLTAALTLSATLLYTGIGGLRASILTDRVQIWLILPALAVMVIVAAWRLEDFVPALHSVAAERPELVSLANLSGWETAASLILGLTATSLFSQGYWQRVYAARDSRALVRGFVGAGLAVMPIILILGGFGFVAMGAGLVDEPSVALFSVVLEAAPAWLALVVVLLGVALVMSSADTALNAISSIVTAELPRAFPALSGRRLLMLARWSGVVVAVPALFVASQGWSVLYLFLLANLLCVAAAGAAVIGLYSAHLSGRIAVWATGAGLFAGLALFPDPAMTRGHLLGAYLSALLLPLLIVVLARLTEPAASRRGFDFDALRS